MKQLNQLLPTNKELTFLDWYQTYPKKVNKAKSEGLWNKLNDLEKHKAVVDIPERLERHTQWHDKQYIPGADVYLRNKKWTDEIITARTKEEEQEQNEDGSVQARLWTMLIQMYGDKFKRSYGNTMPKAWIYGLVDLSQKECSKILRALATDPSEFMPDLPKIIKIRNIGKDLKVYQCKQIGNPTKPETVQTEIQKMRGML